MSFKSVEFNAKKASELEEDIYDIDSEIRSLTAAKQDKQNKLAALRSNLVTPDNYKQKLKPGVVIKRSGYGEGGDMKETLVILGPILSTGFGDRNNKVILTIPFNPNAPYSQRFGTPHNRSVADLIQYNLELDVPYRTPGRVNGTFKIEVVGTYDFDN